MGSPIGHVKILSWCFLSLTTEGLRVFDCVCECFVFWQNISQIPCQILIKLSKIAGHLILANFWSEFKMATADQYQRKLKALSAED